MLKYRENEKLTKHHNFWTVQDKWINFRSRVELEVLHKMVGRKFENNGFQDGGDAILLFTKTWITSEPSVRFTQNFNWSFIFPPRVRQFAPKWNFWKSNMAADETTNFTKSWITLKRFVQSAPNLAQIAMTWMERTRSLAVKIGNQLPVLCACAVKSHVRLGYREHENGQNTTISYTRMHKMWIWQKVINFKNISVGLLQ